MEWCSKRDHGVPNHKDEVLGLLRDVATSDGDHFQEALHLLQSSQWWIRNSKFRSWLTNTWLPEIEVVNITHIYARLVLFHINLKMPKIACN